MTTKRKTELYKLFIVKKSLDSNQESYKFEELGKDIIIDEFLDYYYNECKYDEKKQNKNTINSKNICYYIENIIKDEKIRKIQYEYILFNKRTRVKDVDTLQTTHTKKKKEGDAEKQHYVIKTFENTNRAVIVWEKILGAVTKGILEKDINKRYREWIKTLDENKKYLLEYEIKIEPVPSPEFIEELKNLDKVSLIRVMVDKEKITDDEDLNFSDENISRDEVEVVYKPFPTLSFTKSKVIKYFENFESKKGKTIIKRMVIEGRRKGSSIRLDTEGMKLSKYIETKLDVDGLVDTNFIFEKYCKLLNEDFNEYINNLFIEIDEIDEIDESEEC